MKEKVVKRVKGWVITQKGEDYLVYTKDEYEMGAGYRTVEFECGNLTECLENIASY